MSDDLTADAVAAALPEQAVRAYPALLSTESTATAWAREGAPHGAVVVADYQVSPRGRGGLPWRVTQGQGLGFTLVLRPDDLPLEREGWPYVAASLALAEDAGGSDAGLEWPDQVLTSDGASAVASIGVYAEPGPVRAAWLTVTVLVPAVSPPRAPVLATLVAGLEQLLAAPPDAVLPAYRERCRTLGRQVRARLVPMGPGGPEVHGEAVDVLDDGALVVLTARGRRVAVRPQNLGLLEPPEGPVEPPDVLLGRRPR